MKELIRNILKEELLIESGGAFSEALAVDLWKNVLAYPQNRTKKTYDLLDYIILWVIRLLKNILISLLKS